jgi:hypothetical protein
MSVWERSKVEMVDQTSVHFSHTPNLAKMPQHTGDNPSPSVQNHNIMVRNPPQEYNATSFISHRYHADLGTIVD